ncbi:MAG: hypothetical protein Q8N18_23420 [Opitutaceae bacterium]|nr:hypothetical protein [Opitutaceae bacterium]
MILSRLLRGSVIALLVAALPAAEPKVANDPAVTMSPFEVSAESVDFKGWIKLGTPHFTLYTDAKEKDAANVLRELEFMRWAAQDFMRRELCPRAPTVLVLPTSRSDWRKIASKGAMVEWRVAMSAPAQRITNLLLAEYDWQDEGLDLVRSAFGRSLLPAMNLGGPFTYEQGIGLFFETAEIEKDKVSFGRANAMRVAPLLHEGWMPWGQFFRVTPISEEYRSQWKIHRLGAQAAVFVQYMLSNPEPAWLERLMDWNARRVADADPKEEEFKAIFGVDWKGWQKIMEDYVRGGRYQIMSIRVPPALAAMQPAKLELPVREMRELFVIAQVLNQHVPASQAALDSFLAKGLKTASLRELLVEACMRRSRTEPKARLLREIIAGGTSNAAVFIELARDVTGQALFRPTLHRRIGSEAGEVRELCRRALALDPLFLEANHLLAFTYAYGPDSGPDNVKAIEEIYRRITGSMRTNDVVLDAGVAHWRAGNVAAAVKIAQMILDSPYADQGDKTIAAELKAALAAGAKP